MVSGGGSYGLELGLSLAPRASSGVHRKLWSGVISAGRAMARSRNCTGAGWQALQQLQGAAYGYKGICGVTRHSAGSLRWRQVTYWPFFALRHCQVSCQCVDAISPGSPPCAQCRFSWLLPAAIHHADESTPGAAEGTLPTRYCPGFFRTPATCTWAPCVTAGGSKQLCSQCSAACLSMHVRPLTDPPAHPPTKVPIILGPWPCLLSVQSPGSLWMLWAGPCPSCSTLWTLAHHGSSRQQLLPTDGPGPA